MNSRLVFVKQAGTGVQTVAGAVGATRAKSMFICSTNQTATGHSNGLLMSWGMTDGTRQMCRSMGTPGNQATGSATTYQADVHSAIVYLAAPAAYSAFPPGTTATATVVGVFVGFNSDGGFDINWTTNDGVASRFHCFLMTCDSFLSQPNMSPGVGTTVVTDVPFAPTATLCLAGSQDNGTDYALVNPFGQLGSLGLSDGTNQFCAQAGVYGAGGLVSPTAGHLVGGAGTDSTGTPFAINVANALNQVFGIATCKIESFTSDGYTLHRTTTFGGSGGPFTDAQNVLCLDGTNQIGFVNPPASAPNTVTVSTAFAPEAVLLFGICRAVAQTGSSNGFGMTIAMVDANGSSSIWGGALGQDPSGSTTYENPTTAGGSDTENAGVTALTPDTFSNSLVATIALASNGFSLAFSTTPGASSPATFMYTGLFYLAMGPSAVTATTTFNIRRLRRLMLPQSPDNKRMQIPTLELLMRTGIGLTAGPSNAPVQGQDPQVMLQISTDGGKTWGTERSQSAGAIGQFKTRVRWVRATGDYRNGMAQIVMSDPVDAQWVGLMGDPIEKSS